MWNAAQHSQSPGPVCRVCPRSAAPPRPPGPSAAPPRPPGPAAAPRPPAAGGGAPGRVQDRAAGRGGLRGRGAAALLDHRGTSSGRPVCLRTFPAEVLSGETLRMDV